MQQKREDLRTRAKLAFQQERYEDSKNMMKELVEVSIRLNLRILGCYQYERAPDEWRTQYAFKCIQELRCEEAGNIKKIACAPKRTKFKRWPDKWRRLVDGLLHTTSDCAGSTNLCRASLHRKRHYPTDVRNRRELWWESWFIESNRIGLGKHCVLQEDACWLFQVFGRSRRIRIRVSFLLCNSVIASRTTKRLVDSTTTAHARWRVATLKQRTWYVWV